MIDPTILQFMSLLLNGEPAGSTKSMASEGKDRNFFSDMKNALHAASNKSSQIAHKPLKAVSDSVEKGYNYYLDSFKKELLAQGKPLNEFFLKEDDFPLVKKFFLQCGFSKEQINKFLKDLKSESPGGQINLSYFLQKASELESPEEKAYKDKVISSSATPYIESILRDFQFTPNEMNNVISAVKVDGGGLDLDKFITKLKGISTQKSIVVKNGVDQIISKMEKIGIHLKNQGRIEQISLEDFSASLEQTVNRSYTNNKLASEIKGTLDGLLKRVTASDQNVSYTSSIKFSQNYNSANSLIEEKTEKSRNHLFNVNGKKFASGKNNAEDNESIISYIKQKNDKVVHHRQIDVNLSTSKERSNPFSELNNKMELANPTERNNYRVQAETGQMDAAKNTASFNFADSIGNVGNNKNGSMGYLQASLINQVGKQISRSILNGDQIVRLQLKPPDLGTVKIKIDIKDNTLKLGIVAEHHSVKELLLNNIHQLKEALLHQGVKLDKVDVQIDYNFGQSLNGSKEGSNSGSGTKRDLNEELLNANTLVQDTSITSMNMRSKNNLLDLVA